MNRLLFPMLIALAPVALAFTPAATAHHDCPELVRAEVAGYDAGAYGGDCAGADATLIPVECEHVIWGHHGHAYGAGGVRNCEAGAYVKLSFVRQTLLP